MELNELQAGDKVFIAESNFSEHSYRISVVERTTKTQIVIGDRKFSRITGRRIGDGPWDSGGIEPYDPAKHDAPIAKQTAERARKRKIKQVRDTNMHSLTDEQLDAIIAVLDSVAPGPCETRE